ncbi:hypothetical protein FAES_3301 [Fibrella aestuarina BUZ 2]|uniref:Uncharacterized protein n=1 Tax=Fibrella aestuarina BUZ 2 TaxID=1166018 RepID=I0KB06_9BACT|nr:hypothetical protein [Fibrella aestuarina]CCH01309.1 hypothetical protein FAES_3301 [Fibrella aestuarina BUZ 2]
MVIFDPEAGFSFVTDVVLQKPALQSIYNRWGDAGLHYVAWFSHPLLLRHLTADADRDEQVIDTLRQRGINKQASGRATYPTKLYTDKLFPEAAKELYSFLQMPSLERWLSLTEEIISCNQTLTAIKLDANKPDEITKNIKSKTDLNKYLKDLTKDLAEQETELVRALGTGGMISLDMIWNNLTA